MNHLIRRSEIAFDFELLHHARFLLLVANLSIHMAWKVITNLWNRQPPSKLVNPFNEAVTQYMISFHYLEHGKVTHRLVEARNYRMPKLHTKQPKFLRSFVPCKFPFAFPHDD